MALLGVVAGAPSGRYATHGISVVRMWPRTVAQLPAAATRLTA